MSEELATDSTKTAVENAVAWYLNDKLSTGAMVATQKYLTFDNRLIYLTKSSVAEPAIATVKVQLFERVTGGVNETGYQIYGDHRMEKYRNAMIFGTAPSAPDTAAEPVTEAEAKRVLDLVSALQTSARALV
jgi:hypothetical protein